jgi:hypothetical protein
MGHHRHSNQHRWPGSLAALLARLSTVLHQRGQLLYCACMHDAVTLQRAICRGGETSLARRAREVVIYLSEKKGLGFGM